MVRKKELSKKRTRVKEVVDRSKRRTLLTEQLWVENKLTKLENEPKPELHANISHTSFTKKFLTFFIILLVAVSLLGIGNHIFNSEESLFSSLGEFVSTATSSITGAAIGINPVVEVVENVTENETVVIEPIVVEPINDTVEDVIIDPVIDEPVNESFNETVPEIIIDPVNESVNDTFIDDISDLINITIPELTINETLNDSLWNETNVTNFSESNETELGIQVNF